MTIKNYNKCEVNNSADFYIDDEKPSKIKTALAPDYDINQLC